MKVSELIQELQQLNPDAIVILQEDPEGNGYSPLSGAAKGWYEEEEAEVYSIKRGEDDEDGDDDVDEDADEDDDEDDDEYDDEGNAYAPASAVPCVVLWPEN